MTARIVLECSSADFDAVHEAVERPRQNSETVKVPKAALAALLRDHGKLIRAHAHELDGVR